MPAPTTTTRACAGSGTPPSGSVAGTLDLLAAYGDVAPQLLVHRGVDARVLVVREQLLPALVRDAVGRPRALALPAVEALRRRDQRPVETRAVVAQRVAASQ